MFDAQSFGWLVDFASWLLVAFVLMVLLSLLGRLFPGGSGGKTAPVHDFGSNFVVPSYDSPTMVNEATGRPLATPNAVVDIDGNPRLPIPY